MILSGSTDVTEEAPTNLADVCEVWDWGLTEYGEALERQRLFVNQRRLNEIPDQLVFTEHQPVFTLGMRKGASQHLRWPLDACRERGIAVIQSNRGGDITYHGPGQMVVYPIISLQERRDLHRYLRDLESTVIATLSQLGLSSDRREGKTGIWIDDRKICAIGVAVRSWVTYHGLALNITPDLSHFSGIVPCGITDGTVTSLESELAYLPDPGKIKTTFAVEFARVFGKHLTYE